MKKLNLNNNVSQEMEIPCIGIDLGTTNSAVSVLDNTRIPRVLPIGEDGSPTVPSCVLWEDGKWIVGQEAYKQRYKKNCCYSVKRLMGSDTEIVLYDEKNHATLKTNPIEVSSKILKYMASRVNEMYGKCRKCVITVPAYFSQRQIEDTIKAATLAELDCIQILKEPTAAAYIYSNLEDTAGGDIVIYDLGGGTFDVTHLSLVKKDSVPAKMYQTLNKLYGIKEPEHSEDNTEKFYSRVIGTYGDMMLGGDDIDALTVEYATGGVKLKDELRQRLLLSAELIKKVGAFGQTIEFDGKSYQITRSHLVKATGVVYEKTHRIMSEIDMSRVDRIVLVGGSTKSQLIRDYLHRDYPNVQIVHTLNPDETVAQGAGALGGDILGKNQLPYQDVLPLPIGIMVNYNEVDVCLQKNTSIPFSVTRSFVTIEDEQENVSLNVFQGISSNPAECAYLGTARISNIPKKPKGEVVVYVTFTISMQGRLVVTANVDGTDLSVEFVVDNIFSVETQPNKQVGNDSFVCEDDFEEAFFEILKEADKVELLLERRGAKTVKEREAIEDRIVEMF